MCGITGWTDVAGAVDETVVARMAATLGHRGPDAKGVWASGDGRAALGHRRLSIIDLSPRAHQPIHSEDRRTHAVVNGELYNFRELRAELTAAGHRFTSDGDSEVVVHGYEEWGADGLVQRLRGVFALALWSEETGELILARDRMGVKPLYYAELPDGGCVFASQPRALLAHPSLSRRIDPEGLAGYLAYGYVPHERCMFSGVAKLRPGHWARWRAGGLSVRRWWEIEYRPSSAIRDRGAAAEMMAEELERAVRLRMISDVPVGSFLSGGVDSSQCTAIANSLTPEGLDTFCVGFGLPNEDDPRYARLVAQRLGTTHHDLTVTEEDARRLVPIMAEVFDEPIYDPSCLATYAVSELARRHVKVALSGTGGDELFAGYGWFASIVRYARQRHGLGLFGDLLAAGFRPLIAGLRSLPYGSRAAGLNKVLGRDHPQRAFPVRGFFDAPEMARLLGRPLRAAAAHDGPDWVHRRTWRPDWPLIPAVLNHDLNAFLPDNCLTLLDRTTMAHGLEGRVPLVDHVLVEKVFSLDWPLLSSGDGDKRLLKEVAARWLPEPVLTRPKSGFSPPFKTWLREGAGTPLMHVITRGNLVEDGVIDPRAVERMIDQHVPRRWNKLWLLLILELWYRRWIRESALPASL